MEWTPKYSQIALWTALFSLALAVAVLLFGLSAESKSPLFMFALLLALAEWVYNQ
jgi:hypothetical protein